jgi:RNA polymerase sigma-70 factor (ECF subfamily)
MSFDPETTLRLVHLARDGDSAALEALFTRYLPRVKQMVALRLGYRARDLATHEDIVQDALLRTFQNLEQFEEQSEGGFRNWLARCVQNVIHDHFRRSNAAKRGSGKVRAFSSYESDDLSAIVFAGSDPTPSSIASRQETIELIETALLDMKEHQREVIVLRLFCEMSYEEVGATLGIQEEATVRKLFSRAMSELRRRCGVGAE